MIQGVLRAQKSRSNRAALPCGVPPLLHDDFKKPVSVRQVNSSQSFKDNWREIPIALKCL